MIHKKLKVEGTITQLNNDNNNNNNNNNNDIGAY